MKLLSYASESLIITKKAMAKTVWMTAILNFLQDEIDDSDSDVEFHAIFPKPATIVVKTEETDVADSVENESVGNDSVMHNTTQDDSVSTTENDNVSTTGNDYTSADNDEFSGKLSFETTDGDDRYYPEFEAAIRAPIIKCLSGWNTAHPFNSSFYDKRFIGVLLKELFSDYSNKQLDDTRISFIRKLFEIRVNFDKDRLDQFDSIVLEKQQRQQNKNQNNRST